MIFSPDMVDAILDGRKTRTTRPATLDPTGNGIIGTDERAWYPCRYEVGRDYAVQPGRTKKAVARMRVVRVTGYSSFRALPDQPTHAALEGFTSPAAFADRWHELYGTMKDDDPVWVIDFELVGNC